MAGARHQVADALQEYADVVDFVGGEAYRARSCATAARAVSAYPTDVADLGPEEPPAAAKTARDLDTVFAAAARTGTALEINGGPQ